MHNFHLPLPEQVYRDLRDEAERSQKPATAVARQAIELWLRHRKRVARHQAIATFAAQNAGGPLDLDPDLERTSIEFLLAAEENTR